MPQSPANATVAGLYDTTPPKFLVLAGWRNGVRSPKPLPALPERKAASRSMSW